MFFIYCWIQLANSSIIFVSMFMIYIGMATFFPWNVFGWFGYQDNAGYCYDGGSCRNTGLETEEPRSFLRNPGSFFSSASDLSVISFFSRMIYVFAVPFSVHPKDSLPNRYSNLHFSAMNMSGNLLQSGEVSSDSFYYLTWGEMLGKDILIPL